MNTPARMANETTLSRTKPYTKPYTKSKNWVLPTLEELRRFSLGINQDKMCEKCDCAAGTYAAVAKHGTGAAKAETATSIRLKANDLLKAARCPEISDFYQMQAECTVELVEPHRQSRKMTIKALAEDLGVEESLIHWVEAGKPVSNEFANRLVQYFTT